jgi:ribosome maturation factor RimP
LWAIFVCEEQQGMRIPDELRSLADESARACNAHVIDLVLRGDYRRPVVEVFVDAEGSVTTDLCSDISRRIAAGIDAGAFLSGSYRLEVSSPGIERPLQFPWQYRKHCGRVLHVRVRISGQPVSEVRGTLLAADDAGVSIRTTAGEERRIPFADIDEAKVMPPW